jgi:SprT-like protein
MNDAQLTEWVRQLSSQFFDLPFKHEARFNSRLKTTGGRYFPRSHDIDINPKHLDSFGTDEVEKIIKHELCHYHLHMAEKGYRHQDRDFKLLLAKVGGARFCRSLPGHKRKETYQYEVSCLGCHAAFLRKRKFDVKKYVCRHCGGRFRIKSINSTGRK